MRPLVALVFLLSTPLVAGTLDVRVQDSHGSAIRDAVVYAVPEGRTPPLARKTAVMDQKNRMFIPHVLPVQAGTAVRFPNSDDIRHHVYSFSPAKPFQLPLYKGTPANPVLFDKAGIVTLGCNIHDQMSAYVYVVEAQYYGRADHDGRWTSANVEPGEYQLTIWHPQSRGQDPVLEQRITVKAEGSKVVVRAAAPLKLRKESQVPANWDVY
jgi:plastocyanin